MNLVHEAYMRGLWCGVGYTLGPALLIVWATIRYNPDKPRN